MRHLAGWGPLVAVLLVTAGAQAASSTAPPRRQLSMRGAERAIDLGFETELAGDFRGAREALRGLIDTATTSEERAARERLEAWHETIGAREAAFRSHGATAHGYHAAFRTLKDFGLKRSSALWTRALRDVPELARANTSSSSVRLRIELLRGSVDRKAAFLEVSQFLRKHGIRAVRSGGASAGSPARFEVRLNVDAADVTTLDRGVRVTAGASMIVRESGPGRDPRLLGSISKHRSEERRNVVDARRSAAKRALDDASAALVFLVREELLDDMRARDRVRG